MTASVSARRRGVLYISYDGMLEPLGQGQVIAYLERLTGVADITLLSFEKPADWARAEEVAALRRRLAAAGIRWRPLTYHKRPTLPATLFDILQGLLVGLWLTLRHGVRVVHARSYVAALIGLVIKRLTRARLIFDMRGLWADERVDGNMWPAGGRLYRGVKRVERMLLLGADHIVTLTDASKEVIAAFPCLRARAHAPISVIPTCADLDRFSPAGAKPHSFTLGYVGSAGTRYEFDEVARLFLALRERRPDARLLLVNRNDHDLIRGRLAELDVPREQVEIMAATLDQVPHAVRRMHCAAALLKQRPSAVACAPTKLAEYLGCGVPCISNAGIGDVATILEGERVGVVMSSFAEPERERAVDALLALVADPQVAERCRDAALRRFSVVSGAESYERIYRSLFG